MMGASIKLIHQIYCQKMQPTAWKTNSSSHDAHPKNDAQTITIPSFNSFQKYLQTYATAFQFQQQIKLIHQHYKLLNHRIARLEEEMAKVYSKEEESDSGRRKNKRHRRLADEIEKPYVCQQQRCQKAYGTLGSLQQHQRLKHPELFTEYPRIARDNYSPMEEIMLKNGEVLGKGKSSKL